MIVPFHAASSQRSLWQGALMSTLRTSFPCPLLPPPAVCTLLPIRSCPAFQCCTQTDQLGIQHLNPRPYLWQPQIEHLFHQFHHRNFMVMYGHADGPPSQFWLQCDWSNLMTAVARQPLNLLYLQWPCWHNGLDRRKSYKWKKDVLT